MSNNKTTGVFYTNILDVFADCSPWPKGVAADSIKAAEIPVSLNYSLSKDTMTEFDVNLSEHKSESSFFISRVHW